MLRERRKHANYKPNRRLDRKSSRGMIYENEELRLRTININAEVEQGRSDIRKLRRENEQLKREIWCLRDEYERVNKKMPTEISSQNFQQNGSQSEDSDTCESCQNNSLSKNHKSIEVDTQRFKCHEQNEIVSCVTHSTKYNDLPLVIVEENSNARKGMYENFYKMLKDSSTINPLSKQILQHNHKMYASLVGVSNQIPGMGQLSVLAEENLTNSDSSSSMQMGLDFDGLTQHSGKALISDENFSMQHEPSIHETNHHGLIRLISRIGSQINERIDAEHLPCCSGVGVKEIMQCKCNSFQNDIPKQVFTPTTEEYTKEFHSERMSLLASPPDLFVTNALASSYHCAEGTLKPTYACYPQQKLQFDCDSKYAVEDDVPEGLLDQLGTPRVQLEKRKSVSQNTHRNSGTLFTSKLFRSEINLLVSSDGVKPNIFLMEEQIPYAGGLNVNTTQGKTSLQALIQNLPEVLGTSNRGTTAENFISDSIKNHLHQQIQLIKENLPPWIRPPVNPDDLLNLYSIMSIEERVAQIRILFRIKMRLVLDRRYELLAITPVPILTNGTFRLIKLTSRYILINLQKDQYQYMQDDELVTMCSRIRHSEYI